jgi:diguanylate cyclase (GGDEF)-like protein
MQQVIHIDNAHQVAANAVQESGRQRDDQPNIPRPAQSRYESPQKTCASCVRGTRCGTLAGLLTAFLLILVLPSARAQTVLTKAGQIHDLDSDFDSGTRVHLTATVTYYNAAEGILFVQDATGGVYVNTSKPYPIHIGDMVMIDGAPSASYRTEIARDPEIQVVDRGANLPAPQLTYRDLVTGRGDCKLATIRGKVKAADLEQHAGVSDTAIHLDLNMADGEVQVYLQPTPNFRPESLLDATVEIVGVAGGAFDAKGQLTGIIVYAPTANSIKVLEKPDLSARQLPLTPIDSVFESRHVSDLTHPVRIRGSVTYYKKGGAAVLEDKGKSIYVQTRGMWDIAIGDVVDAIGFASDREYAPSLEDASLVKTGKQFLVTPHPVTYAEASSGLYSDNLVSITGEVVSQLHDSDSYTVIINSDGHQVSARLGQMASTDDFQQGSKIRVSGICRIVPEGAWRAPHLSHIELRNADDVALISNPSWFTVAHLLELLGLLLIAALGIAIKAMLLKWRVVHQTAWISRSMILARERSRILELISSNLPLEQLLEEICTSIRELLPGAECQFQMGGECDVAQDGTAPKLSGSKQTCHTVALRNADEMVVGTITVTPNEDHTPVSDREEVYRVLSELTTLAMRQSLLYQGLIHHSTHDPLTDLPNRRLFESRLTSALQEAASNDGQLAVIYIDINRFKYVNDKYGHKIGDLYLQEISVRLGGQLRSIDMLARIGGDEFVVIAPSPERFDRAYALTNRLQGCFDKPFTLEGETFDGSASFGFARYPDHGLTPEDLTRHADHAMYISKHETRISDDAHGIAIITPDELELALLKGRFRLAYQPQFSAAGKLTGLETLIRLDDPVLGIITPDAFISVAERHPVILRIGDWALRAALSDANKWQLNSGDPVTVAVNVSVRQLEQSDYANSVLECLKQHDFPPERLEIELVERSLMFSGDKVLHQLERLRQAGVRISLDDFGTEQSCLSILHKLPIDTIKLDRSFIRAMDDEPAVLPIVQAIVSMAHSLGKRVVAEAIEHVGPVAALLNMGKMDYQGYLFSRPVPSEDVHLYMESWRTGIEMPEAFQAAKRKAIQ